MKKNLKRIMIMAAMVCGVGCGCGMINNKSFAVPKWIEKQSCITSDGKKVGDGIRNTLYMDDEGYFTECKFTITPRSSVVSDEPKMNMLKKMYPDDSSIIFDGSVLDGVDLIDCEIKDESGNVIKSVEGVKLVDCECERPVFPTTKKIPDVEKYTKKVFTFDVKFDRQQLNEDKKLELVIKKAGTDEVLCTGEQYVLPADNKVPALKGADGKTYKCDQLLTHFEPENKNYFSIFIRDKKASILKNYIDRKLTMKIKNVATGEERAIDGVASTDDFLDEKGVNVLFAASVDNGTYEIDIYDGTAKVGGFGKVVLDSK